MIYLQDLSVGLEFHLGSFDINTEEIVQFANTFDPQPFHIDENVATNLYGGLIASGWYTASVCNLLAVRGFMGKAACLASPGVDELRFLSPVFAGDTLTGLLTVEGTRIFKSKPG